MSQAALDFYAGNASGGDQEGGASGSATENLPTLDKRLEKPYDMDIEMADEQVTSGHTPAAALRVSLT